MNFGMVTLNQDMETRENYVTQILTALLFITEDFYKDISDDVERWFDTSNYDYNDKRPLPMGENKKRLSFFKDELGGKIIIEVCAFR